MCCARLPPVLTALPLGGGDPLTHDADDDDDDASDAADAAAEVDGRYDFNVRTYIDMMQYVTDYVIAREPWSITDQDEAYRLTVQMARAYVHTMRYAVTRCVEPSQSTLRALDTRVGLWRATMHETWTHALCSLLAAIISLPDLDDDPTIWSVHTRVGLIRAWVADFCPFGAP